MADDMDFGKGGEETEGESEGVGCLISETVYKGHKILVIKKNKNDQYPVFSFGLSGLTTFAERELREAGLFDHDSDYGGMLGKSVLELVKVFSSQGHSGCSAAVARELFNRLAAYQPINPKKSPNVNKEYMEVGDNMWQSTRYASVFSCNQGKTWYDIDEESKIMKFLYWHVFLNLFKLGFIEEDEKMYFWEKSHKQVKFGG